MPPAFITVQWNRKLLLTKPSTINHTTKPSTKQLFIFHFLAMRNTNIFPAFVKSKRFYPLLPIVFLHQVSTKFLVAKTFYSICLRHDTLRCPLDSQGEKKPFFSDLPQERSCRCSSPAICAYLPEHVLYLRESNTHEHTHISGVRISTTHNSFP